MRLKINRSVKRYQKLHSGEPCVILCNGPTLDMVDLKKIDCPTIGVNASWMVHDATYHCATDDWQFKNYASYRNIDTWRNLFTADVDYESRDVPTPKSCVRLKMLDHQGEVNWSWDLTEGVYLCTTITWYALQLARWMDFNPIYLVGFDLRPWFGRSKFWAHPRAYDPFLWQEVADTQDKLMGWARRHLPLTDIINLSPHSACGTLETRKFEEVFS